MKILYSDIAPLALESDQIAIPDCFREQIARADRVEIAVGYVSKASLKELDALIETHKIKNIILVIGMYYADGMPEGTYRVAMDINEKWRATGIGEIRVTTAFKYHGKLYVFYKNGAALSGIMGSANLGAMKIEASNSRQYEMSALTTDAGECEELEKHILKLKDSGCSSNLADIADMPLVHEVNASLAGSTRVTKIPQAEARFYEHSRMAVSFALPIKVPAFAERHMDDKSHYTKSNLNVCYAEPRRPGKPRNWYETQLTVGAHITRLAGYPEKKVPFFVVTDDGYTFKAHTTSAGNKQFSAVGDELLLGRWIKGRLAAAGLVTPVDDTGMDRDRIGMITKEMLTAYGRDTLILTKTDRKMEDGEGNLLDVWFLSFELGRI